MEEKTIQSIPVMPFALMMACITAVILFIVGIIYAVIGFAVLSAISGLPTTSGINTTGFGILFGAAAKIKKRTATTLIFVLYIRGAIEKNRTTVRSYLTLLSRVPVLF
jgi:hypothetical protein